MKIKNKIAFRLMTYFSIALLIFSLITGLIFIFLFAKHTKEIHKTELEKKALSASKTLSDIINDNNNYISFQGNHCKMHGQNNEIGFYIKFLDSISMADIWIVDNHNNQITRGHGQSEIHYKDLPEGAESVIDEVFNGNTAFSESFSVILNKQSITVGTPVYDRTNNVIAAVLVHSPVDIVSSTVENVLFILVCSTIISLIIACIISAILSMSFTKPLNKMKNSAIQLSEGNYFIKTNVKQSDEIGELANAIDILSDKLIKSSQESEKLENMRQNFIANISHELRTPITVIRGSLEALCDNVINDKKMIDEYHHQMLTESIHLQRLVNDLLDLSRLQNADFIIEMSEINLCDAIKDSIAGMKKIANSKNVSINFQSKFENCKVIGDYGRIRQMLNIVIDNAVKFSPENKAVNIILNSDDFISLSITDTGCGIPHEHIPYIFDRFYRTKSPENINGTGLGLSIAKQIAQRHNIDIYVESIPFEHTTFLFKFKNIIIN